MNHLNSCDRLQNKFDEKIEAFLLGGKDSTITAAKLLSALSNPSLVHIFGNTTEFDNGEVCGEIPRESSTGHFLFARMMSRYSTMSRRYRSVYADDALVRLCLRRAYYACNKQLVSESADSHILWNQKSSLSAEANITVLRMMLSQLRSRRDGSFTNILEGY